MGSRERAIYMRETVRSLSTVGLGELRDLAPSTRGPEQRYQWCIGCDANRNVN